MLRTHYSANPVDGLRLVEQPECNREVMKPRGLWYGVDGEWEEWCRSEMPEWLTGGLLYSVRLGSERVLRIATLADLDSFAAEYRLADPVSSYFGGIDWRKVADRFDGIEIAPYQWRRRLEPGWLWYYGWDCASGCVWRPRDMTLELIRDDRVAHPGGRPPGGG